MNICRELGVLVVHSRKSVSSVKDNYCKSKLYKSVILCKEQQIVNDWATANKTQASVWEELYT